MSSTTEAEGHRETGPDRRPAPQLVKTGGEGVNRAVIAIPAGAAQLRVAVNSSCWYTEQHLSSIKSRLVACRAITLG
jgi:hypothetical protein